MNIRLMAKYSLTVTVFLVTRLLPNYLLVKLLGMFSLLFLCLLSKGRVTTTTTTVRVVLWWFLLRLTLHRPPEPVERHGCCGGITFTVVL